MKLKTTIYWLAGVGAIMPLVVVGCQPSVQVNRAQMALRSGGATQTAAAVAIADKALALPSDKPTVRPGEADNGNEMWDTKCASCHGTSGAGDGKLAAQVAAKYGKLPDLTDFGYTRDKAPLDTYISLSGGAAPHAFGDRDKPAEFLTDQQRWNLVYYVWSLHTSDEALKLGGATFNKNCSVCHGTKGRGDGFLHQPLNPKPRNFTEFTWMMDKTDNRLYRSIQQGRKWTAMPGWSRLPTRPDGLTQGEIYVIVDYLRAWTYTTEHDIIVDSKE